KQAESLAPHLTKGKQVSLIVRDLHIATFAKSDGSEGYSLEGVADFDDFARSPRQDDAPQARTAPAPRPAPAPAPRQGGGGFEDLSDDIPFIDPMKRQGFHAVI
ncbi:hypothetical protein ACFIQF_13060, partial [Comamonas sp. J-3]